MIYIAMMPRVAHMMTHESWLIWHHIWFRYELWLIWHHIWLLWWLKNLLVPHMWFMRWLMNYLAPHVASLMTHDSSGATYTAHAMTFGSSDTTSDSMMYSDSSDTTYGSSDDPWLIWCYMWLTRWFMTHIMLHMDETVAHESSCVSCRSSDDLLIIWRLMWLIRWPHMANDSDENLLILISYNVVSFPFLVQSYKYSQQVSLYNKNLKNIWSQPKVIINN